MIIYIQLPEGYKKPLIERITDAVCQFYGIQHSDLTDYSNEGHIVEARLLVAILAKDKGYSTGTIAQTLKRDHSNISRLLRRGRDLKDTGDKILHMLTQLENDLSKAA